MAGSFNSITHVFATGKTAVLSSDTAICSGSVNPIGGTFSHAVENDKRLGILSAV